MIQKCITSPVSMKYCESRTGNIEHARAIMINERKSRAAQKRRGVPIDIDISIERENRKEQTEKRERDREGSVRTAITRYTIRTWYTSDRRCQDNFRVFALFSLA